MNKVLFLCASLFILISCKQKVEAEITTNAYKSFGKEITNEGGIELSTLAPKYKAMRIGDTINAKIIAKVNSVCQVKGCWIQLDLGGNDEVMVKFKDYEFFIPKDIADEEIILNGKAFIKEVSVEEQRHYAEDAGKKPEEIALITNPKRTFSFEADGVLLKK